MKNILINCVYLFIMNISLVQTLHNMNEMTQKMF